MKTFTIFTGTYNSYNVIEKVFESIKKQTFTGFEWIVIDDCSTDLTFEILNRFKNENEGIDIKIFQNPENLGIAYSRKKALEAASGKYFITWDHDDEQSSEQLKIFNKIWQKYESPQIANIFAKVQDQHHNKLGYDFPEHVYISDYIQLHNKYLTGSKERGFPVEHHVCVKTEKYLKVLNYYAERKNLLSGRLPNGGDVWGMLAYIGYKSIFVNDIVRTYYINEAGRKSLSSAPKTFGADKTLENKLLWVNFFDKKQSVKAIKWKLRNRFAVSYYTAMGNNSLSNTLSLIHRRSDQLLCLLLYVPAKILAIRYKKRINFANN
jgi:glycosyltransferase involved in cell wall biosynthesis